ncbi:MAG TPA: TetR/AcrR family transcriptional regulator [Actinomycetota bacterium]|nr:TetR/AcrR family transcriptional regulator [Actinomycetota bacterium]
MGAARTSLRALQDLIAADRRDFFLERAAELFSERGYHATSMRDIAEAIGIRAPSLYAHIQRKEDLLYGIVTSAATEFLSSLEAVRASSAPPAGKLREAMRAHVRVVADNLQGARVFHHEWRALSEPRRGEVRELRDRYEALWDQLIAELRPDDPTFARLLALSAANWTYVWYDPRGSLSPEEIADRFTDLLLRGLERRRSGKIRGG